ncbi:MAG TPA: radical SAM protein [Polyangiaceae bacterium]|nr:radical SAM protein [Polyangiaceae bacterium]
MTEPRRLPLTPKQRVFLPLAAEARPQDLSARPRVAVWELTLRCDLSCAHCGSRAGKPRDRELSTEECLRLVDELAALSVLEVSLIGGEAHLHPGFLPVLRALKAHGIEVGLTTGGRRVDDALARAMAAAGLDSVSVSIDGLREAHDTQRALVGSFDAALTSVRAFRDASVFVSVNTQINRISSNDLEALFELIVERGARAWQIALTVPMGRAADRPDWLLQPSDLLDLFPRLAALKQRCDDARVRLWPGNNVGYFGPYEHVLRGQMPLGHAYSCGAGVTTLGIESDGTIKGCPSLPSEAWVGGNVREHSLKEIWERAPRLRYIRDRTASTLWGFCADCYYADECRAGCTWTSFSFFGRAGNNPYCHHRALELAARNQRERLIRVEAPPGEPFDTGRFEVVLEPRSSANSPVEGLQ